MSSAGFRLQAIDDTTDAGSASGPARSAVERGSGTGVSASATIAGGATHHGTKCMLGSTGEVKMARQSLVQLGLDVGAEPGSTGQLREHRIGRGRGGEGKAGYDLSIETGEPSRRRNRRQLGSGSQPRRVETCGQRLGGGRGFAGCDITAVEWYQL